MMCPKRGQARLEPALNISKISTNTSLEELTNTRQSEDVWVTYFGTCLAWQSNIRVITGLNPSKDVSLWEVLNTPRIESYGRAKDTMQTPNQTTKTWALAFGYG
jgi:hypothetical protein